MIEKTTVCPIGTKKHPAEDKQSKPTGHLLCEGHFKDLGKMLRNIELETRDLDAVPSIAMSLNTGGGGHSGGGRPAFERAPARLDPVVLTDPRHGDGDREDNVERHAGGNTESVLVVLSEYADRVREARHLTRPEIKMVDCVGRLDHTPLHGPTYGLPCMNPSCQGVTYTRTVALPVTVTTERKVLSRHDDLIATWPDVAAVFARLRRLLGQLRGANGTAEPPMGRCPVDDGGKPCKGPLWPVKPKHTSGEWTGSAPSAVYCGDCEERWEGPSALARLALILEDQRKPKVKAS